MDLSGMAEVEGVARQTSRGPIISRDPAMKRVLDILDRVAGATCTVLVTGESGTGKELVVAALHDASPRADKALVAVNCGAIPENLIESELFGHARGAFTGAQTARRGYVGAAEGGTLFLDEVGELPLAAQVKLLRLLQQREYTPVGESRPFKADVRVVAATHRDLLAEVKAGRFREDLYYRLDVIRVQLPALRERRGDIESLAMHFLRNACERFEATGIKGLTPEAIAKLSSEAWPGNVRALENTIERAALLALGEYIGVEDINVCAAVQQQRRPSERVAATISLAPRAATVIPAPPPMPAATAPVAAATVAAPAPARERAISGTRLRENGDYDVTGFDAAADTDAGSDLSDAIVDLRAQVEEYENKLIRDALAKAGHNKTRAAQMLGLHRTTLIEMMKRKRIEVGPSKKAA